MSSQRIPLRIARGLATMRDEAARLDRYGANIDNYQARTALKTIKDECDQLRQYLGLLVERSHHLAD